MEHDARVAAARILQSCPQRDLAWALNRTFALDAVREPQRVPVFADPLARADAACLVALRRSALAVGPAAPALDRPHRDPARDVSRSLTDGLRPGVSRRATASTGRAAVAVG